MNKKKLALSILQIGLLGFVLYSIRGRLSSGLDVLANDVNYLSLGFVGSVLIFTSAVIVSGILWTKLLSDLADKKIDLTDGIRINTASWLYKYIPGQIGGVVNKLAWAKTQKIDQKTTFASEVYQNVFLTSSSLLVGGLGIGLSDISAIRTKPELLLPLFAALAVIPLLVPKIFELFLRQITKLLRKKPLNSHLKSREVASFQMLFLLPRIINMIGFALLVGLLADVTTLELVQLSAGYVLAGIIGIFAFFVPSGIGVREAVIVIIAGPVVGVDVAIALSILARISATASDGVLAIIYGGLQWRKS